MSKKVSLSIENTPSESETIHLPYTSQVAFDLSRKYKVLLQFIQNNSELYKNQIVQNMILEYAQSKFEQSVIDEVVNSIEPKFTHDYFDEERQVALFRNCLTSLEREAIALAVEAEQNTDLPYSTVTAIRKILTLCTESYYDLQEGYFPFEFCEIEGLYVEKVPFSSNDPTVICDADGHYNRQLSLLINVGHNTLNYMPVSSEVKLDIQPGDLLIYPSNYSCSYYLSSVGFDGTILKLYRLSTED